MPETNSPALGAEVVEYACSLAPDLMGDYIENVATGMDTYSIRQPLGVSARDPLPTAPCFWRALACTSRPKRGPYADWEA